MTAEAQKHLWEIKHPYYCEYGNYFNNECHFVYGSWESFFAEMGEVDKDLNLLFRWDWLVDGDSGKHTLRLFYMGQRKAQSTSSEVSVTPDDEEAVRKFLTGYWDHMKLLWGGVS